MSHSQTLTVRFSEDMIRRYGGEGRHIHSDISVARTHGFDGIVVWGTLLLLPFSLLLARRLDDPLRKGYRLEQRLLKPVLAGEAITYAFTEPRDDATRPLLSLAATNEAGQTVAVCSMTASISPNLYQE